MQLINITDEQIEQWSKAYPDVDIQQELLAAAQWLDTNPKKRKKNYARFLTNWFKRAQDNVTARLKQFASAEPGKYSEQWWARQESNLQDSFDKPGKLGVYAQTGGQGL